MDNTFLHYRKEKICYNEGQLTEMLTKIDKINHLGKVHTNKEDKILNLNINKICQI